MQVLPLFVVIKLYLTVQTFFAATQNSPREAVSRKMGVEPRRWCFLRTEN